MKNQKEKCACGCGEIADTTVMMLRRQDIGTAEALGWTPLAVGPMLCPVAVVSGHEDGGIEGYVSGDRPDERPTCEAEGDE